MKFYNDFNSMFDAQSGLKKDMSVFNSIDYDSECVYYVEVDPDSSRSAEVYCPNPNGADYKNVLQYCRTDNGYRLFSIQGCMGCFSDADLYEMCREVCPDIRVRVYYTSAFGDRCLTTDEAEKMTRVIEGKLMNTMW